MLKISTVFFLILLAAQGALAKSPPAGTGFQDTKTNVLIMLDTSGSMDTEVPNGALAYPYSVAFDSSGNIYIASKDNSTITKYNSAGEYQLEWGSYGTANSQFKYIYAIAVGNISGTDYIFVADQNNGKIKKFTTDGTYVTKFSMSTSTMKGLAVDSTGNVYAANSNGGVEKYNTSGTRVATWTWSNDDSTMLAVDAANDLYVTEYNQKKIRKLNTTTGAAVAGFSTTALSYGPLGIAAGNDGMIYVSDYTNSKIYRYNATTRAVPAAPTSYGSVGTTLGKWKNPAGIAKRPSDGTIWVADYLNNRIQGLASTLLFTPPAAETRMDQAKTLIKAIVSNSNLTDGANFGLMKWNSTASMVVNVSSSGANSIYTAVDALSPGGGTYLDVAMDLANSYLFGASTPIIPGAWCQKTILIVISDGFWTDTTATATATSLYNDHNIQTFAIGFQVDTDDTGIDNYINISQAGGTYPRSPVFADNWQSVYEALSQYITDIISTNLTFSAPTIMPSVTSNDSILQSTFNYKSTHQWKGALSKYALNDDGSIGALAWEAGGLLAVRTATSRNIWTVNTGLTAGLNNFITDNLDDFRSIINENAGTALNDSAIEGLINFVRGVDTYNEFGGLAYDDDVDTIIAGERWKLADIYHSRAVAVGAPGAFTSQAAGSNTEAYYRYANGYNSFKTGSAGSRDAMIYAGSNDGLLHAFKSSDGTESWAFIPPSIIPSLKDMISPTSGRSVSIYGVDGTPVVKDIYYDGSWHTILISGLRQGGKSYFALDVTDPTAPQHLFTFAFNSITNVVSYWAADGTRTNYSASGTIPAEYDFSKLGESWSEPSILRLPVGTSGAMKWTAVFGGGYNSGTASYGAKLYVINLEDGGKILKNMTISDDYSTNGIVTAVPPKVTAITADSTTLFDVGTGAIVYFSDLEGKLWKINLSGTGTLYQTSKLFNAESTSTNTRYSFQPTATTVNSAGTLMQFYGTGNLQSLGEINTSIANRAYAAKDAAVTTSYPSTTPFTVSSMANVSGGICPTETQNGWYFNLSTNEKITAKATVYNSTVLFPRYIANNTDVCSPGVGYISEHDSACGTNLRTTNLGSGVPTEAVVYKNKIYIGISTDQDETTLDTGFTKQGNLIVGTPATTSTGTVNIESWWEDF